MDKLLKHFKTQTALAEALNTFLGVKTIKTGHIYYWKKKGIPANRAIQIEAMTGGLFNRRLLCPEFFNK